MLSARSVSEIDIKLASLVQGLPAIDRFEAVDRCLVDRCLLIVPLILLCVVELMRYKAIGISIMDRCGECSVHAIAGIIYDGWMIGYAASRAITI